MCAHIGYGYPSIGTTAAAAMEYCIVATFTVADAVRPVSMKIQCVCVCMHASCDASTKEEKHRTKVEK